jgi:competence protein ComGC
MKQQKQFRSVTSLLMIMTMVIISSFCILISSNQSTQNHSINNASNEITASNTSNDPIFYINQFEVDSLTIPGLGPTN